MGGQPTEDSTMRWVRVILLVLATTGGGFGVSQGVDLFSAKQWQEDNVQKLMEAERMQDRLTQCRAKVDAFEQQNQMLIALIGRMQDDHAADDEPRGRRRPEPLPALPGMP